MNIKKLADWLVLFQIRESFFLTHPFPDIITNFYDYLLIFMNVDSFSCVFPHCDCFLLFIKQNNKEDL